MSFITKKPFTYSVSKRITRQQISDVISYNSIITTPSLARVTQKYLEKLITLSKKDCLISRRKAAGILFGTKIYSKDLLIKYLFDVIAVKYKNRNGGYSRRLKYNNKIILQLV